MADTSKNKSKLSYGDGKINSGHLTLSVRGAKRAMKAYTVTETEFIGLPMWKTILKFSDHVAFSAGSFAVGLVVQAVFTGSAMSESAKAVLCIGLVFSGLIAVCAICLRRYLAKSSLDIETVIRSETIHDDTKGSDSKG